jgi:hypothetical protein
MFIVVDMSVDFYKENVNGRADNEGKKGKMMQ